MKDLPEVRITAIDIPFTDMIRLIFGFSVALVPAAILIAVFWGIVVGGLAIAAGNS